MIFELTPSGNPCFSGIHPVLADLLQAVATDPWERYPEGSKRLLPSPGSDEDLRLDWLDHVQPGLRHQFDVERNMIADDLKAMSLEIGDEGSGQVSESFRLEIPRDHAEAWLTTLNALRLAIASDHDLGERELAAKGPADLSSDRGSALMQVNFYALVQECLLQAMEDVSGE
jgi:hypothetical protein